MIQTDILVGTIVFVASFGAYLFISDLLHGASWLISWLIAINAVTFLVYWFDKTQSTSSGRLRVPKRVMYMIAITGAAFSSLIGVYIFRHKTKQMYFKLHLWFILSLQLALLWFLFHK